MERSIKYLLTLSICTLVHFCTSQEEFEGSEINCFPARWHFFTLIYKSVLPIVPCGLNYRRIEYDYGDEEDMGIFNDTKEIGILGSFENLTYWAMKEEVIFELLGQKKSRLLQELELLNE